MVKINNMSTINEEADDLWPMQDDKHNIYFYSKGRNLFYYLVLHHDLLHRIQVMRCTVAFVLQKMYEAHMLRSRVIEQVLRWVVAISTQEI